MQKKYRELSYPPFGLLQVCHLTRLLTIFVIERKVFYRDCFTPLVSTKFRQTLEPHINHVPSRPRRGVLKPSGSLLIGFSGGLGSTVLLDLVHKVYCTKSGSDELKGGKEHPRKNRVWKKIYVCYVEISDVYPEVSQYSPSLFLYHPKLALDERSNYPDSGGCRSL